MLVLTLRSALPLEPYYFFFFFNDTATTEIYTLSLHDALPISSAPAISPAPVSRYGCSSAAPSSAVRRSPRNSHPASATDRKSTRLNSSHGYISYAVFCL